MNDVPYIRCTKLTAIVPKSNCKQRSGKKKCSREASGKTRGASPCVGCSDWKTAESIDMRDHLEKSPSMPRLTVSNSVPYPYR